MIHIKNLSKSFHMKSNTFHALENINLTISQGEAVLIKGKSGSGKSTLLSILAMIMKPSSGLLEIDSENIISLSDIHTSELRKNKIGYITQTFNLFDSLTLQENLLPALVIHKMSFSTINKRIDIALEKANIIHKKNHIVKNLSGGEKQRCIIARAIVNNPDIIICDEPTANLDKENSLLFIDSLKEFKKEGKTLIIATHDPLFNNLDFIDSSYEMKEGKLG